MLNAIIRFSLQHCLLVVAASIGLLACGTWQILRLPIDVFPDLNRPRVTVMTEAHGMAPEEVERLITFPLETALNGATDVQAVRTSSAVGLSVVNVEFNWGTDIYNDRQIVAEKIALVADVMPDGVVPQLAPVSSIMGQIMIIGMWSNDEEKTTPMELRTLADWVVRQRLLTIPGVSQVFVMGGDHKQFQVLVNPNELLRHGVTLEEVKTAVEESNENSTGGYLDEQGPQELLVRSLGRIKSIDDLKGVVVKHRDGNSILLDQVARVIEGAGVKRGESTAYARQEDGTFAGGRAVVLTINKQPNADTRKVTDDIIKALKDLKNSLPPSVHIQPDLYQQKTFIDLAIHNVREALIHGGILVVLILFIFLFNFRTTFITLTAIPLSIVIAGLIFRWFGVSINTMTLGGLAVAIGELVDDAIVDVENVFRRLRENRHASEPKPALLVVFQASVEVRNPIVYGTAIVVLVFLPLFALSGMEGRMFTPLGIAYIASILSSLLVSMTLTPVLAYLLLAHRWIWRILAGVIATALSASVAFWILPDMGPFTGTPADTGLRWALFISGAPALWWAVLRVDRIADRERDTVFLSWLKMLAGGSIRLSLRASMPILILATAAVGVCVVGLLRLERDFLPPYNEGAIQLSVALPPGTSLKTTDEVAKSVEERLMEIPELQTFVRKTGRAELDEHAVTVNGTEFIATFDPEMDKSRADLLAELRDALKTEDFPGTITSVEQPLSHLISHMLSGVKAQIGIKLYGDDLIQLRNIAEKMKAQIESVEGVTDLYVEQQSRIPQLQIKPIGHKLQMYGLRRIDVNHLIETAMNGEVVSQVLQGERQFDLLVRMDEPFRENIEAIKRLSIDLPGGGTTPLSTVADVVIGDGPNTINREQVRRRIILSCNTAGRGLVDVVEDIQARLEPIKKNLPPGYFLEYGGQFQSQQSASRVIGILFVVSLVGMFLVLYTMFRSVNLSLQVMVALPMAFIGAVVALYVTGQTLTIASMVGFISLCGIASRNGILLIGHYIHLVRHEGQTWSREMIVRAGQERLAPVLMTALTSGIGLVPLAMAAGEPGKEILYPVATVIIGGLISSTLLEFLVRPALFWHFGVGAGRRVIEQSDQKIPLVEKQVMAEN